MHHVRPLGAMQLFRPQAGATWGKDFSFSGVIPQDFVHSGQFRSFHGVPGSF